MGLLLLIRHGRTAANVDGILAGRLPGVVLDTVGRETVDSLATRLAHVPVRHVVTSPLERTVETAARLFSETLPVTPDDRLIECDYGTWQGQSLRDLALDPMWQTVQQRPDEVTFPGGEAMQSMFERATTCVREWDAVVTAEHGDGAVWAAISHGDVIKAICADALGMPLRDFQRIMVDPASVTAITYTSTGSAVLKVNDAGDAWLTALGAGTPEPTLGGQSGQEQG